MSFVMIGSSGALRLSKGHQIAPSRLRSIALYLIRTIGLALSVLGLGIFIVRQLRS